MINLGVIKLKSFKKLEKYYTRHVWYAKAVYVLTGVGLGVLITYPLIGEHPLRWGTLLLVLGLFGSLYPLLEK